MNHPTLKYLLNHAASTTMLQKLTVSRCTIERTAPRDRQPNSRGVSSQAPPPPPPLPTSSLGNRASAGGATCAVAGRCASSSWRRPPDYWEPSPISRSPYKFSGVQFHDHKQLNLFFLSFIDTSQVCKCINNSFAHSLRRSITYMA